MLTKLFGNLDWRHWAISHLVWIVAVSVALILGHSYIAEHDQRLIADQAIKVSEAKVSQLQQQIAANDAAAAQKTQTIIKIVHDAATPAQQLAAVPLLSDVQLNARPLPLLVPNGQPEVAVELAPLVQELGKCKQDAVQLTACQMDLTAEKAIVGQKSDEIKSLKKKPSFWKRVTGVAKAVGIGISIGLIASRFL